MADALTLRYSLARCVGVLSAVLVAGAAIASGGLQPNNVPPGAFERKLDAPLRLFVLQPESAQKLDEHRLKPLPESGTAFGKAKAIRLLPVLIRIVDGVDEAVARAALAQAGVAVQSRLGPIYTGELPATSIRAVAELDIVFSIELARPMPQRLNYSALIFASLITFPHLADSTRM